MTAWPSGLVPDKSKTGTDSGTDRRMSAEAVLASQRYAAARKPLRNANTAWAIGRRLSSRQRIADLWGKPDAITGSGPHVPVYVLNDKAKVLLRDQPLRPVRNPTLAQRDDSP